MHPLVARIHPALRSTLIAFFVGRAAYWLGLYLSGGTLTQLLPGVGPWTNVEMIVGLLDDRVTMGAGHAGTYALLGLSELSIWLSALAVYKIVRREGLPQTADRAVWLWMCVPVFAGLPAGSNVIPGLTLALWAIEFTGAGRAVLGAVLMAAAAWLAPQAVVMFPMVGAVGFRTAKDELSRWIAALLPTFMLAVIVLYEVLLGDSPRYLFQAFSVRQDWAVETFQANPLQAAPMVFGALLFVVWALSLKKLPKSFAVGSLPAILALAIASSSLSAAIPLLFAAPIWAQLALFAQDPEVERPLIGLGLLALVFLA